MRLASVPSRTLRRRSRRPDPGWFVVLLLCCLTSGCVSTPRPVGPVMFEGVVPAPQSAAGARAAPVPGATRGPLVLREPELDRSGAAYRWSATIQNPSDTTLVATVVASLLDETGAPLGYESLELELAQGEERTLEGEIAADGRPLRFRIEYWVRLPPPPERRIERIG